MSTVVQNEESDYDIDAAIVLDKSDLGDKGTQSTRNMVANALRRKTKQFNAEPEVKTSCVRVKYADGYHIDFAVYRRSYDSVNEEYAIKRNKVDDRSFDGLRVATMHRVKGLEFEYVFVAAVNNRIIPLPSAINKTDVVSEAESITSEKCLLYVAMTRAQKGVYITSYGKKSDFLKP